MEMKDLETMLDTVGLEGILQLILQLQKKITILETEKFRTLEELHPDWF